MGMVYKRGNIWWVKFYRNGRPFYESAGSRREGDARRLLRKREGQVAEGKFAGLKPERVTYEALAEDLRREYQANGRASQATLDFRLVHLGRFFRGRRASDITAAEAWEYAVKRQEEGASNGTVNRELTALRRMLNLGLEAGKVRFVPRIPQLEENNVRQGFFEVDEFLAVREHLPEYLKPFVTFDYQTGWRKSEVTGLTWDRLDLHTGAVRLEPGTTKNMQGRTIYLSGELLDMLHRLKRIRDAEYPECPWVFHRNGQRIGDIRKAWRRACRLAGLQGKLLHDFRRSAVRNLTRAGVPERVAMARTGHKTRSVFDRYNIVSGADHVEAANRLETYLKQQEAMAGL